MIRDPIVEEVRKHREEYAKRFNYDLAAICRDLRKKQKASGRKIVSFPPKRPKKVAARSKSR
jgi:hypothetical protein